jgi:hypothetical protein
MRAVLQPASPTRAAAPPSEPPQLAIRIGSIDVQILPPAPPQPAAPAASTPRSPVPLARGFTSSFGLRQG